MLCKETRELLDPYLDGELDLVRSVEVERHLSECSGCAEEFAGLQSLQALLRSTPLQHVPPATLQGRVRTALYRQRGGLSRRVVVRIVTGAVAAALVVAAVGLWSRTQADPLAGEIATAHIRSLQSQNHLMDVESSDNHTVKPWFNGRLDYAPSVPNLSGCGFSLAGARLDYVDNRPVAALVYKRREHLINLFEWPEPDRPDSGWRVQSMLGYSLVHWRRGGVNFWAVSDLNPSELQSFAAHVVP